MPLEVVAKADIVVFCEQLAGWEGKPVGVIQEAFPILRRYVGEPPGNIIAELVVELNVVVQLAGILGGADHVVKQGAISIADEENALKLPNKGENKPLTSGAGLYDCLKLSSATL